MKRRILASLLLFFLLPGCKESYSPYRMLFGNMIVSSSYLSYSSIYEKEIVNHNVDIRDSYHANIYSIPTQKALDDFYKTTPFLSVAQEENRKLSEDCFRLYFFTQIPKGYSSYKRNNVQYRLEDGSIILYTDTLYSYQNRPEIIYSLIDLKKDISQKEDTVFSYYFDISIEFNDYVNVSKIRLLFDFHSS